MEPLAEQQEFLAKLEAALRLRICSVCVDRNVDGTCDVDAAGECILFDRLPQIARSISRVHSDKMDDYITAMRGDICMECCNQRLDGTCKERDEVRCTLDRYLLPIIETIEEVRGVVLEPGKLLTQP